MKENDEEAIEEIHKRRTKRGIKVAIIESIMVVAVILTVVITTLLTSGYKVKPGEGWGFERTGLVQIQSRPTRADVVIDGESSMFGWTNLSRSMTEGEHEVVLSREGYDGWQKKIYVTAGRYYRLDYPRLFLKEKKVEDVRPIPEDKKISFGKDGNIALEYSPVVDKKSEWKVLEIDSEEVKERGIDVSKLLLLKDETVQPIEIKAWSGNNEKVLLTRGEEWFILDLKTLENSLDLSKEFGFSFDEVKVANDSMSVLYVVSEGNLRRVDVNEKKISSILVKNVRAFSNLKLDFLYVADDDEDGTFEYGFYKDGEKQKTEIKWAEIKTNNGEDIVITDEKEPEKELFLAENLKDISFNEYYGDYYMSFVFEDGEWIVLKDNKLTTDLEGLEFVYFEKYEKQPVSLDVRGNGELIILDFGDEKQIFDTETENVVKITTFLDAKWLDEHMIFNISEAGELVVADFDRQNEHKMIDSAAFGTEIKISKNNRYLYFISKDNKLSRIIIAD